jgi:hypothetical protein
VEEVRGSRFEVRGMDGANPLRVGLRIRLKLPTPSFNNLPDLVPHNAEVQYPIRLKFHRVFTHKAEVPPKAPDVADRIVR